MCCRALVDRQVVVADSVTVGATLLIVTVWVAVLLLALSLSLTCTDTIELAGPSGNEQTKLPAPVVVLNVVRADLAAVGAAVDRDEREVSSPGSLVVKL